MSQVYPQYILIKNQLFFKICLSKYGGGWCGTFKNVCFRARNARLCMSQVFHNHNLIKKTNYFINCFFFCQKMVGEDLRHAKTCVSEPETDVYACLRFSLTMFWFQTNYLRNFFFSSSYGDRRPETCINVRFGPWNTRFLMSHIFPHHILIKKEQFEK